jgi:hypothetical protein
MAAIPLVHPADRIDLYVGSASSLVGLIPLVAMPPSVIDDAPLFEARLSELDRCALAREGERLLARAEKSEETITGVLAHVGNVGFNLGVGAILGFGFDRWGSALINVVLGTAVGEAVIFTYPSALKEQLARYRAGDLASTEPSSRIGFAISSGAPGRSVSVALAF